MHFIDSTECTNAILIPSKITSFYEVYCWWFSAGQDTPCCDGTRRFIRLSCKLAFKPYLEQIPNPSISYEDISPRSNSVVPSTITSPKFHFPWSSKTKSCIHFLCPLCKPLTEPPLILHVDLTGKPQHQMQYARNLPTHLHLIKANHRMSGAIPPFPNTPSWRGAQLKHRDNFTFT
jgi:hypothetical protein